MGVKGLAAGAGVVVAAGVCASAASAQPTLELIESPAGSRSTEARAISADGSTVVGVSDFMGFTWTRAGGRVDLPPVNGRLVDSYAISADGAAIAGTLRGPTTAFVRDAQGQYTDIGALMPGNDSFAHGVSRDGSVAAGTATVIGSGGLANAYLWRRGQGVTFLPGTQPGHNQVFGEALSADGRVAVGQSRSLGSSSPDAAVWRDGVVQALPGRNGYGWARGVSSNGRWAVGITGANFDATRWDLLTGELTVLNAGVPAFAIARGVSDDGSVVVGESAAQGYVWRQGIGAQTLAEFAASLGLTLPPGASFASASGVSADGLAITGTLFFPGPLGGTRQGFVLFIPTPGAAVVLGVGCLLASRRRR